MMNCYGRSVAPSMGPQRDAESGRNAPLCELAHPCSKFTLPRTVDVNVNVVI
jgi:hypothetical protein